MKNYRRLAITNGNQAQTSNQKYRETRLPLQRSHAPT